MPLMLTPAPPAPAADDGPPPDYHAVVESLFKEADTCRITGHRVDGIVYELDRILTSEPSRQKLKEMFLAEQPRYLGRELPPLLGEHASSRLEFVWKNVEQKEVGRAALLEGDQLLINGSLLFTLSPTPGEKNLAFLRQAAHFANRMATAAPAGTPSYRRIVSGFFARAAACKITGYHNFRQENPEINYTTPDAAALQELKRILLHTKALYLREARPHERLFENHCRYQFTWLDAQGAPVGHAELADRETIRLEGGSLFTTNDHGVSGTDLTLFLGITRLVDPGQFPPPGADCHAMVQALFSKAASCSIQGSYAPAGVSLPYDVNFTASDAPALQALQEIFLFEKPRYDGRTEGDAIHITAPSRLHFTWKDAQGRELGGASLLNEDRLEFEPAHEVFCTTSEYCGRRNITLLTRAARFALPHYFKNAAQPGYQDLVQGLFAKAAACRMKGWYTDVETDTTHDVDSTAADAPALLALKQILLSEKPDYRGITEGNDDSPILSSSLHLFWTDVQGKKLGRVALLSEGLILFESTHDLFTLSSGPGGRANTTLLNQTARLALPAIDGKPQPPQNDSAVKK